MTEFQGSCGTLWFINDAALASIKWQISLKTRGLQDIFNRIETKFKVNLVQIWPTRDNLGQWLSKSTYKVSLVQIATLYTVSTVSESSAMFTIDFAHGYEHYYRGRPTLLINERPTSFVWSDHQPCHDCRVGVCRSKFLPEIWFTTPCIMVFSTVMIPP